MPSLRYRTLFISDTHLGLKSAKAEYLHDFLKNTECDTLYLVGDIIDGWKLRKSFYWPETNTRIIHQIMKKVQNGTRVIYVPGNHDEALRDYLNIEMAGIEIRGEALFESIKGKRFLVLHGDEFDCVVMNNKWLAHLGSWAYDVLLWTNRWFNFVRRKLGFGYWSLSAFLKHQVKQAVAHIGNFEEAVVKAARDRDMDGVICGHIHHAAIIEFEGVTYANCGDWVESCSALAEDAGGSLRLIHWARDSAILLDEGKERTDAHSDTDRRVVSPG